LDPSLKSLEYFSFDAQDDEDDEDSHSVEEDDENSDSDDDICTFDDLMREEKENNTGFCYKEISEDEETSRGRESIDSGMGSTSPPSSPVTMKIPQKTECNEYVAIADFHGSKDDGEVDLSEGQRVKVLHKSEEGWWFVEGEGKGWAPSNFLEEVLDTSSENVFQQPDNADLPSAEVREDTERNMVKLSKGEKFEVVDTNESGHFVLVRVLQSMRGSQRRVFWRTINYLIAKLNTDFVYRKED
jgi:hypothetical protein